MVAALEKQNKPDYRRAISAHHSQEDDDSENYYIKRLNFLLTLSRTNMANGEFGSAKIVIEYLMEKLASCPYPRLEKSPDLAAFTKEADAAENRVKGAAKVMESQTFAMRRLHQNEIATVGVFRMVFVLRAFASR
mgnify:CR=1 FL=1